MVLTSVATEHIVALIWGKGAAMNSGVNGTIQPRVGEAPAADVEPLPWQLKAVAFLFIAAGTNAVFSMVAGLFHDSLQMRLDVFCLPLGIGLLRSKEGARSCAGSLLLVGLILTGLCVVLLGIVRDASYLRLGGVAVARVPWFLSILVFSATFLLLLWMMRVLDRQEVWKALRSARKSSRYPRGAAWIIVGAIIAGLGIGCAEEYVLWRANPTASSMSSSNQRGLWRVSHACLFDDLSYAVFQHAPKGEALSSAVTGSNHEEWLTKPDGTKLRLPGDHQLYEFRDGALITSDKRVTRDDFEAFMASSPEEYTIDALLEFVAERRREATRRLGGL